MKIFFNFYPPFFFTRTRIRSISPDWKRVVVTLKKSFLTRNYVGTTFGGSLYAASDPFFMLMLIKILGMKDYIIWDKGAEIEFKKPVRSNLTYYFQITDQDLENIRLELQSKDKILPVFSADGFDETGTLCVTIRKILYIRKKFP